MGRPRPFLVYICSFFEHNSYRKNCWLQPDSNWDVGEKGEHADHLTTTTVLDQFYVSMSKRKQTNRDFSSFYKRRIESIYKWHENVFFLWIERNQTKAEWDEQNQDNNNKNNNWWIVVDAHILVFFRITAVGLN